MSKITGEEGNGCGNRCLQLLRHSLPIAVVPEQLGQLLLQLHAAIKKGRGPFSMLSCS